MNLSCCGASIYDVGHIISSSQSPTSSIHTIVTVGRNSDQPWFKYRLLSTGSTTHTVISANRFPVGLVTTTSTCRPSCGGQWNGWLTIKATTVVSHTLEDARAMVGRHKPNSLGSKTASVSLTVCRATLDAVLVSYHNSDRGMRYIQCSYCPRYNCESAATLSRYASSFIQYGEILVNYMTTCLLCPLWQLTSSLP